MMQSAVSETQKYRRLVMAALCFHLNCLIRYFYAGKLAEAAQTVTMWMVMAMRA
jgi:hypothetical protein